MIPDRSRDLIVTRPEPAPPDPCPICGGDPARQPTTLTAILWHFIDGEGDPKSGCVTCRKALSDSRR